MNSKSEAKKEIYLERLGMLLEENNLAIKHLPPGTNSLMRAISDCLYFTPIYHEQLQQFVIKYLKTLIAANRLPPRLGMFQGNNMLLKDFSSNPTLAGFDKLNIELISLLFRVRVVIYHMSDDNYLAATIINSRFDQTIELARNQNQYHGVHNKHFMEKAGFCQNIVLNIINQIFHGTSSFQNINGDNYINLEYESFLASKHKEQLEVKPIRGRHKKSLSDGFEKNFDSLGDQQLKFYNMFMNNKPQEDFSKFIRNERKDTADSNLARNANLEFIDEPWYESPPKMNEYAIKNYPVANSGLSSQIGSLKEIPDVRFREHTGNNKAANIFFNENLSLAEIERMEKAPPRGLGQKSPLYYLNTPPPGITPTRYPQKSPIYNPDMQIPSPHDYNNGHANVGMNNLTIPNNGNSQMAYTYINTPDRQQQFTYQQMSPQMQYNGNPLYLKRTGNKSLTLSTATTNDGIQGHQQIQQQDNQGQDGLQLFRQASIPEKKKPLILEESQTRHTGRLKFFDENKSYGFIIMDEDGSDIFVHYDDLSKANISKDLLKTARQGNIIKLAFSYMKYVGKYDKSRKATDIELLSQH